MQFLTSLRRWFLKSIFKFWTETWSCREIYNKSKWCSNWFKSWSWWQSRKERISSVIKIKWTKLIKSWSNSSCYSNRQLKKRRWSWSKKSKCVKSISLNNRCLMESLSIKTWVWMIQIYKKNLQSQKLIKRKKEDLGQDWTNTSMKGHQRLIRKLKNLNERKSKRSKKQRSRTKNLKWWFQIQRKRTILKIQIRMNITQSSI